MIKLETLCWLVYVNIKGGLHSSAVMKLFSAATICSPCSV